MVRICYSCALLLILAALATAETQVWHGLDGQPIATGAISNVEGNAVRVLTPERPPASIQLDRLSAADRAFVVTREDKTSEFQRVTRKWTSANGKYHVEAKAIVVDDTKVSLAKSDGRLASVPLDKLSADDRAYLTRLQQVLVPNDDPFSSVEAFVGKSASAQPVPEQPATGQPLAAESASGEKSNSTTVYVTKSGTKYHSDGCRFLNKSKIPMPLSEAASRYSPSSVCHPPTADADATSTSPSSLTSKAPKPRSSAPKATPRPSTGDQSVDRNPYSERATGQTATGIPTFTGPRGGQYHYSKSGKKVYEKKR